MVHCDANFLLTRGTSSLAVIRNIYTSSICLVVPTLGHKLSIAVVTLEPRAQCLAVSALQQRYSLLPPLSGAFTHYSMGRLVGCCFSCLFHRGCLSLSRQLESYGSTCLQGSVSSPHRAEFSLPLQPQLTFNRTCHLQPSTTLGLHLSCTLLCQ